MRARSLLTAFFALAAIVSANAQITDDPSYTPYLYLNANIIEYKLGGQFDGFVSGLDPVYNVNGRLKVNGWFDFAWLDGKISLRDTKENQNDLRKYMRIGAGINFALFESTHEKEVKFIVRMYNEGNYQVTEYLNEYVPMHRQLAVRAGLEHFRFIAEPTKRNATEIDNGFSKIVYLETPDQNVIWYEGISNWYMNSAYLGLSLNEVFSAKVENSHGSGTMSRYRNWYVDVMLPVSVRVDDVVLQNDQTVKVTDAYKKNPFGLRFGVSTGGFVYAKIEAGMYPGIKSGWFMNSAIGWTFKAIKRNNNQTLNK